MIPEPIVEVTQVTPETASISTVPDNILLVTKRTKHPYSDPISVRDWMEPIAREAVILVNNEQEAVILISLLDLIGMSYNLQLDGFTDAAQKAIHDLPRKHERALDLRPEDPIGMIDPGEIEDDAD